MEITVEMVERLREKAPVSYAQAKEALEYSEGNLLDALIYLEEKGAHPPGGGDPVVGPGGEGVPAHGGRTGGPGDTGAGKEKEAQEPAGRGGGVAQGGEAAGPLPAGAAVPALPGAGR